jgi:hypothetical protein
VQRNDMSNTHAAEIIKSYDKKRIWDKR